MSGFFTLGETKDRPGVYKRYENLGTETPGATEKIAACVVSGNWGPLNKAVHISPSTDLATIIGAGTGEKAITELFAGGVGEAVVVRAGSGGTKGTITLKDNDSTPANVVTLTALYEGNRAFTITIKTSLEDASLKEATIYEGTTALETVTFTAGSGEVDGIIAAFANSAYVTATKVAAGTGTLAAVAQAAFTAGTNPTVNSTAYSTAFSATEAETFDMIITDSNDSAVHALLLTFIQRMYAEGAYPMAVVAEASSVAIATRLTNAATFNDEKMHYVLNSWIDTAGTVYDGYLAAARIAGMICACPANESLTHAVIQGAAKLNEALTNAQVKQALKTGCLCFTLSKGKQVWIEKAINSLITLAGNQDAGWKKIRRVKERMELMSRVEETVEGMIGTVDNDSDGRAAVVAAAQRVIDAMVGEKKLISGTAMEDENNPAQGDSAWFVIAVDDLDSLETIYLTFGFEFAPSAEAAE